MRISYKWLCEYLPVQPDIEKLSRILTSIGLEVEDIQHYEEVRGGLKGLVIGKVLTVEPHPNADKLRLTTVNIGKEILSIVCGAPNVAVGQQVVVAPVGSTIYPVQKDPLTMKVAKIRGVESHGMICAEDEMGLGTSHEGILVLTDEVPVGTPAKEYFAPYEDWVYEIGLTPNRMDAMSHLGVARDVCAWFTYHEKKKVVPKSPFPSTLKIDDQTQEIKVEIRNKEACQRYSGISVSDIRIGPSPKWMQERLKAIGVRPINNIVDITNYVLHETGQPLHAFDADAIKDKRVIVQTCEEGTPFMTLDGKERKLYAEDLMICDGTGKAMCIGGVFGGDTSGVKDTTRQVFLESAWFHPLYIRRSSIRHQLRTDAAARFEKGIDIQNTVPVLRRAAQLMRELADAKITSDIVDVYPLPVERKQVGVKYHYLKKLSGKNYHPDSVIKILTSLGFEIAKEGMDELQVLVPTSKPDIELPADIVEEIMRIDGLDNVEIPSSVTMTPSVETLSTDRLYREKMSGILMGQGFHEIFTNSITNSAYFEDETLQRTVKLLNNLSAELDILRPSMLESGLETIAFNINRKNADLKLFEFGKTYEFQSTGDYKETDHLALYVTGAEQSGSWKNKGVPADFYYLKGLVTTLLAELGAPELEWEQKNQKGFEGVLTGSYNNQDFVVIGIVGREYGKKFDIKQPVFYADLNWNQLISNSSGASVEYREVAKYPAVERDLSMVVDKHVPFKIIEETAWKIRQDRLKRVSLFDLFESEKIGENKRSLALSFTFQDEEKTMTDEEVDRIMNQLMKAFETDLQAEIRKG